MSTVLDALRALGADDRGRRAAVHVARHGVAARRRGDDRRVGVVAVRVRAAAVRCPLRQGRDGPARRQARAFVAAHRHDGRDAAFGRRPGRRPAANVWHVEPGSDRRADVARGAGPVERDGVPGGGRGDRRRGDGPALACPVTTQPGDAVRGHPGAHGLHGRGVGPGPDRARPGEAVRCGHRPARRERADADRRRTGRAGRGPHACIRGVAHIRGHETDRIAALVNEINAAGRQRDRDRGRPDHRCPRPCTAGCGRPTRTTGWPPRARSSGWWCRACRRRRHRQHHQDHSRLPGHVERHAHRGRD